MSAVPQTALPTAFGHLAETLGRARTLEALVRPLLEALEAITGMESTYLTSIDETAGRQTVLFARNTQAMQIPESLTVPWGDTLCRRALDEGRMHTDDVPSLWGDSEEARTLGIHSYISAPVRMEDGHLQAGPSIGVVAANDADTDVEALIARADAAMYAAKRARRAG